MTAITTPPSRLWALICNVRRVPLGDGVTPSDMFPPESRTLCADLTARFCTHNPYHTLGAGGKQGGRVQVPVRRERLAHCDKDPQGWGMVGAEAWTPQF